MTFENEGEGNVTHPDSFSSYLLKKKLHNVGGAMKAFFGFWVMRTAYLKWEREMNELDLTEWANMAAIVTEALEMRMFFPFTQGYNSKERQAGLRATKNIRKKIKTGKKN